MRGIEKRNAPNQFEPDEKAWLRRAARQVLGTLCLLIAAASPGVAATLSLPSDAGAPPAQSTLVPIVVDDATGIVSADITITYNASVAIATGVMLTPLSTGHTLVANIMAPGLIRIALFGPAPLAGSGNLLNIAFTSVGPLNSQTPLTFGLVSLNESMIQVTPVDGSYCVQGPTDEIQGLMVSLNPGSTVATLNWQASPLDPPSIQYNVYLATMSDLSDITCFASGIPGSATSTTDDGVVDPLRIYFVAVENCRGVSTLGFSTSGIERQRPPCP